MAAASSRPRGPRGGAGLLGALLVALLLGATPTGTLRLSEAPVADAAERDDAEMVRTLVRTGADVNASQGDGMTALHWSARNGNAELTSFLLEQGAELEATTRIGDYTPLHMAARAGEERVVSLLLDAGADLGARSSIGGVTALHFAAEAGSTGAIDDLVAHGAEVDAVEDKWGQTPLIFASDHNRLEAVRALLAHGADPAHTTKVVDVVARYEEHQREKRIRDQRLAAQRAGVDPALAEAAEAEKTAETAEERAEREAEEEASRPIEEPEPMSYAELVGGHGGLTPLLHAVREGHEAVALALLEGGADVNQPSGGDHTSPLLMATINGHFDLAMELLDRGADPNLVSTAGNQPLYATINTYWAPKSRYPQQHAYKQQQTTHLDLMKALLDAGADPDARLEKHLWYMSFNFDLLQVDTKGATPFWRAAYGLDIPAMKLLLSYGADPTVPTQKVPERRWDEGQGDGPDPSGLPPVPVGGPGVHPIHAASGVGYGQGFAANAHRHVHDGWVPAVRFLVEEVGADVNARDQHGYTPLHHAAARGDNELIHYLVEHGADVTAVSRAGQTTADMANGPYQRTQPYPETVKLLEELGSKNNHNCVSC